MKKLLKTTSLISTVIIGFLISIPSVYADLIVPGQGARLPRYPNSRSELILYCIVGAVIVLAIVASAVILIKIRKKNARK